MSKDESLEPLSRGLAEMLITDLSTSEEIKVVERSRLNEIIAEIKLQENPFFDSKKATKFAKGNLAKGSTQSYEAFLRYSEALSLLDAEGNEAKEGTHLITGAVLRARAERG